MKREIFFTVKDSTEVLDFFDSHFTQFIFIALHANGLATHRAKIIDPTSSNLFQLQYVKNVPVIYLRNKTTALSTHSLFCNFVIV